MCLTRCADEEGTPLEVASVAPSSPRMPVLLPVRGRAHGHDGRPQARRAAQHPRDQGAAPQRGPPTEAQHCGDPPAEPAQPALARIAAAPSRAAGRLPVGRVHGCVSGWLQISRLRLCLPCAPRVIIVPGRPYALDLERFSCSLMISDREPPAQWPRFAGALSLRASREPPGQFAVERRLKDNPHRGRAGQAVPRCGVSVAGVAQREGVCGRVGCGVAHGSQPGDTRAAGARGRRGWHHFDAPPAAAAAAAAERAQTAAAGCLAAAAAALSDARVREAFAAGSGIFWGGAEGDDPPGLAAKGGGRGGSLTTDGSDFSRSSIYYVTHRMTRIIIDD